MGQSLSAEVGLAEHGLGVEDVAVVDVASSPHQTALVLLSHGVSLEQPVVVRHGPGAGGHDSVDHRSFVVRAPDSIKLAHVLLAQGD